MAKRAMSTKPARTPLSRDAIVATAITLADRDGLAELSMRRLGAELKVDAMVLYRHVRSKDELLDAMADAVMAEAAVLPPAGDGDWTEVARAGARAFRSALLAHPGVAPLVVRRPSFGPHTFALTEVGLAWLRTVGFSATEAPRAFQSLITLVLGAVSLELSFLANAGTTLAEQAAQLTETHRALPADQFPHTVALAGHAFPADADAQFDYALDLLLVGLQARLDRT